MSNLSEHTNNAEQFENLLKDAFLDLDLDDPKNGELIDALSMSVMTPIMVQQSKSKGSFKRFIGKISLQSVLFIGLAIVGVIIGFKWCEKVNVPEKNNVLTEKKPDSIVHHAYRPATVEKQVEAMPEKEAASRTSQPKFQVKTQHHTKRDSTEQAADAATIAAATDGNIPDSIDPVIVTPPIAVNTSDAVPIGFPQFTEQDVKANVKQKKKMMDQLMKCGKVNYMQIPNGKLTFKGEVRRIGDFYMQSHEVTNLEYRTFLFDLVFAKKKEEYLKAKPNNAQWVNCIGSDMFDGFKNEYFSNKVYDDYPVVNITAEAARMYCVWLDELLEREREDGTFEFYIDLPRESEWIYSAKGGFTKGSYPWGTDFIQNNYNNFLANFNVQRSQENFNQPYGYRTQMNRNAYTSAGLATNKDTVATTNVFDYNPNAYGLYCMSGNVAEWVISENGQTTKALGGSWGSDFEHLKIDSESEFKGRTSSPFIGFRILVSIKHNQ
jgi:formylglycine-generating enzyme required for sulfatase activity